MEEVLAAPVELAAPSFFNRPNVRVAAPSGIPTLGFT
jgi:hypothetical protein